MSTGKKVAITMSVIGIVILLLYGSKVYVNDYYHATDKGTDALHDTKEVTVTEEDDYYLFEPEEPLEKGIIFYPGGKVEETAYAPLMQSLAESGYLVFLIRMPWRLAMFDMNAADDVINAYPDVKEWSLMGHSLGGAMAASYTGKHTDTVDDLILLGAYSTSDLSDRDVHVLSIYGSEDKVMNRSKYDKNKKNLPDDMTEYVIEGGNHAGYGCYGEQKGDGTASITQKEQQQEVVDQFLLLQAKQEDRQIRNRVILYLENTEFMNSNYLL